MLNGERIEIGRRRQRITADFSDSPEMTIVPHRIAEEAETVLPLAAILILWNLVLAVAAFAVFNRADVR